MGLFSAISGNSNGKRRGSDAIPLTSSSPTETSFKGGIINVQAENGGSNSHHSNHTTSGGGGTIATNGNSNQESDTPKSPRMKSTNNSFNHLLEGNDIQTSLIQSIDGMIATAKLPFKDETKLTSLHANIDTLLKSASQAMKSNPAFQSADTNEQLSDSADYFDIVLLSAVAEIAHVSPNDGTLVVLILLRKLTDTTSEPTIKIASIILLDTIVTNCAESGLPAVMGDQKMTNMLSHICLLNNLPLDAVKHILKNSTRWDQLIQRYNPNQFQIPIDINRRYFEKVIISCTARIEKETNGSLLPQHANVRPASHYGSSGQISTGSNASSASLYLNVQPQSQATSPRLQEQPLSPSNESLFQSGFKHVKKIFSRRGSTQQLGPSSGVLDSSGLHGGFIQSPHAHGQNMNASHHNSANYNYHSSNNVGYNADYYSSHSNAQTNGANMLRTQAYQEEEERKELNAAIAASQAEAKVEELSTLSDEQKKQQIETDISSADTAITVLREALGRVTAGEDIRQIDIIVDTRKELTVIGARIEKWCQLTADEQLLEKLFAANQRVIDVNAECTEVENGKLMQEVIDESIKLQREHEQALIKEELELESKINESLGVGGSGSSSGVTSSAIPAPVAMPTAVPTTSHVTATKTGNPFEEIISEAPVPAITTTECTTPTAATPSLAGNPFKTIIDEQEIAEVVDKKGKGKGSAS